MMKNLRSIFSILILSCFSFGASAQIVLLVQEPSNLAGSYNFTYSTSNGWGADMDTVAITAEAVFAYDGTAADSLGCEEIVNTADVTGKIAVVYRGSCNFSLKAHNVQDSGAVACIIINNVPGGPVGMGAGTNAAGVVIPVAMISDTDGAALRDAIMAGDVTIFLGNNTNLFANNLGSYKPNIGMAKSQAIPTAFAQSSADFNVPVSMWVHNYGSGDATGVTVNAAIDRDGTEVYNETSSSSDIPSGDSLLFPLPPFSEDGYEAGFYTITFTIDSDNTDEFPDDNEVTTSFWINDDNLYSKSRVDPDLGPLGSNGVRPATGTEFQWCIAMSSENASSLQVTGMTFSTVTNSVDLTAQAVQLAVYEWNDPIADLTFDDLTELTDNEFYDYPSDLQSTFVTHNFAEPIELIDDQRYLACATIFIDNMFLTVDAGLDYTVTYDSYPDDVFFPLNDISTSTWYAGGFGPDNTPALIVNLESANGIAEDFEKLKVTPYPNPTVDQISVPLGMTIQGDIVLQVYDIEGRLVISDELCQKNGNDLRIDVSALSNGLHTFNLGFVDGSSTSFKVMVTK